MLVKGIIKQLFPPGTALDDDTKADELFSGIEYQFELSLDEARKVVNSAVPNENSYCLDSWQKMTGSQDPGSILKMKENVNKEGYSICNNKIHFEALLNKVNASLEIGKITFLGTGVTTKPFTAGQAMSAPLAINKAHSYEGIFNQADEMQAGKTIGREIAIYSRNNKSQKQIEMIEKVKHAHLISKYEVTHYV